MNVDFSLYVHLLPYFYLIITLLLLPYKYNRWSCYHEWKCIKFTGLWKVRISNLPTSWSNFSYHNRYGLTWHHHHVPLFTNQSHSSISFLSIRHFFASHITISTRHICHTLIPAIWLEIFIQIDVTFFLSNFATSKDVGSKGKYFFLFDSPLHSRNLGRLMCVYVWRYLIAFTYSISFDF